MNTILSPIDFSSVSKGIVAESARLAQMIHGRVILLHVIQPLVHVDAYAAGFGAVLDDAGEYNNVAAEKYSARHLARLRAFFQRRRIPAEVALVSGHPAKCIVEQAKKWEADFIVLGSHGHTAFYDLLVGSTAAGVLRRAACPVIVVPAFKRAARKAGP
jgi:nucleotide-binding universal stress UspA family protein